MARTGLTWTLKLNDAMSGAAAKIAAKLGMVQGKLQAIDDTKVSTKSTGMEAAAKLAEKEAARKAAFDAKLLAEEKAISDKQEALRAKIRAQEAAHAEKVAALGAPEPKDSTKRRDAKGKFLADEHARAARELEAIQKSKAKLEERLKRESAAFAAKREAAIQRESERVAKATEKATQDALRREQRAFEKAERQRERMQAKRARKKPARATAGGMMGGVSSFALARLAGVAGAGYAAIDIASKAMEAQKFKQATIFAFEQLLGSAAKAQEAWGKAEAIASSTGMSLQETASAMNALVAQGMGIAEVEELTKRFADLKALNPAANIDGIARAMMQIKATGRLQGDELMQLNEAGLSSDKIYSQLEKRLGKTRAEVLKLQEAGKISSKDAIEAIKAALAEQTGKPAGAVAQEAARKTLGGAIGRLRAELDKLLAADSPAMGKIAEAINKIVDALASGKGAKVLDALSSGLSRISKAFGTMSEGDIDKFFVRLAQAITVASVAIDIAVRVGRTLYGVLSTIVGGLASAASSVGSFASSLTDAFSSFEGFKSAANSLVETIKALASQFFGAGSGLGTAIIQGLVQAVLNGAGLVVSAVTKIASEAAKQAAKEFASFEMPSFSASISAPMGDSLMMGNAAAREVKSSSSTRTFAPTVNVNVSGGSSNTGGMVSAIGDALKSLNNAFA